jgi:hypothetical protein
MYTCRECEHEINTASEVCPYCGADLAAVVSEGDSKPPTLAGRLKVLLLFALLLGSIWGFLLYIVPDRRATDTALAETQATRTLREIAAQLADYAAAQGGRFPASLEALGDRARQPAQRARSEGYAVTYSAAETPGGATHYQLMARPERYGFRSFYLDESGVLRWTREDRAATGNDPPQ